MNKVIIIGRLTRDPDIRYTQGQESTCIARYTLAVDRPGKDKGADFISCIVFGNGGEFAEKYLRQGTKIAVVGRIQTGSYTNKNGQKVYTTDVVVESHEFCERRADNESQGAVIADSVPEFMQVPEGDDSLPFN